MDNVRGVRPILGLALVYALLAPSVLAQQDPERVEKPEKGPTLSDEVARLACAEKLYQLWVLQTTYMSQYGGRLKTMPKERGAAFWLALTRTKVPLIDDDALAQLVCPSDPEKPRAGYTSYRGPNAAMNSLKGDDVVGACSRHADGVINALLKSGKVLAVGPKDPLYRKALQGTSGLRDGDVEKTALCKERLRLLAQAIRSIEAESASSPDTGNAELVKRLSALGLKESSRYEFFRESLNEKGALVDPWGNPFGYYSNRKAGPAWPPKHPETFDLYSFGPNGVDDHEEGDDIGYE